MFLIMRRWILVSLSVAVVGLAACNPPDSPDTDRPQGQPPAAPASQAAAEATWRTNYGEALQLASEQGRPVLVNFTGSDWCPPCIQLKKDVFDTDEFKSFAGENLILLELDFPRAGGQSEELRQQNQLLQQRYQIEGYPTLLVLNAEGMEQKRHVGYMRGGPQALARWVR
jgi:protein disulfide-isomerase